jgi:hypothetical protein
MIGRHVTGTNGMAPRIGRIGGICRKTTAEIRIGIAQTGVNKTTTGDGGIRSLTTVVKRTS